MMQSTIMRWALLGEHPRVDAIIDELLSDPRFLLVGGVRTSRINEQLTGQTGVRLTSHWEDLTSDETLNFVLLAGDDSQLLEGAKVLASMGRSLVIFPLAEMGTSWIHELSLVRDDVRTELIPLWPWRGHPGVQQLQELIEQKQFGRVLEIQFERNVHKPVGAGESGLIALRELDDYFLHDAEPLCRLIGRPTQVTAVTLGHVEGACSRALTTISASGSPEASWAIQSGNGPDSWRLTVRGETGTAILRSDETLNADVLTVGENSTTFPAVDVEKLRGFYLKESLLSEIGRDSVRTTANASHEGMKSTSRGPSPWAFALQVYEMLDASHRSRRRRRTIELLGETPSERSQFKAQMAAVGCGLLMATLMGVVGLLMLGAFVESPSAEAQLAEQHDTLFRGHEFAESGSDLSPAGAEHLHRVLPTIRDEPWPVVIETAGGTAADRELSEARRARIVQRLEDEQVPQGDRRVHLEPVKSPWMRTLLSWGRVLVFFPLFLFLAMQGLYVLAKPSAETKAADAR
ncbi:MAG: hypothetical protein ACKVT0_08835 [Planctomycetaceae bacterium]